jgi:hypothetical protein
MSSRVFMQWVFQCRNSARVLALVNATGSIRLFVKWHDDGFVLARQRRSCARRLAVKRAGFQQVHAHHANTGCGLGLCSVRVDQARPPWQCLRRARPGPAPGEHQVQRQQWNCRRARSPNKAFRSAPAVRTRPMARRSQPAIRLA